MSKRNESDRRQYVIIGGGPAGLSAAETLRQAGYEGKILIVSKEEELPYDKTMLSKATFQADMSWIGLRKEEFYKEYGIDFLGGEEVKDINMKTHQLYTNKGKYINYDKLLIASGGKARTPPIPGVATKGVHVMRTYKDM